MAEIEQITKRVRLVTLAPGREEQPPAHPGAHLRVRLPIAASGDHWRSYSLVDGDPILPVRNGYRFAVQLETHSRGGSRYVHEALSIGRTLEVTGPHSDFECDPTRRALVVAGGIGVTPLLSVAAAHARARTLVAFHYFVRSHQDAPFLAELKATLGSLLHVYVSGDPNRPQMCDLLGDRPTAGLAYVCGPERMLRDAIEYASDRLWPRGALRFEAFDSVRSPERADVHVHLLRSGVQFRWTGEQSLLDAAIASGADPLFQCRKGECGACVVGVIDGAVEHHDFCLSEEERRSGKLMQLCVSRPLGNRLVLDC